MLCYNATWGFGVVEHIDYFYQQLEIDFEQGVPVALDGGSGTVVWQQDLRERYSGTPEQDLVVLPYGRSNSPGRPSPFPSAIVLGIARSMPGRLPISPPCSSI